jgi:predicted RNase H-like nuclease (RuvC/YqgF family)
MLKYSNSLKNIMSGSKRIYVYVPEEQAGRWEQLAQEQGISLSSFIREKVEEALEQPEGREGAKPELSKLKQEISRLEQENSEIRAANEDLRKINLELGKKIKDLEKENSKLQAENERLKRGMVYFHLGGKGKK